MLLGIFLLHMIKIPVSTISTLIIINLKGMYILLTESQYQNWFIELIDKFKIALDGEATKLH